MLGGWVGSRMQAEVPETKTDGTSDGNRKPRGNQGLRHAGIKTRAAVVPSRGNGESMPVPPAWESGKTGLGQGTSTCICRVLSRPHLQAFGRESGLEPIAQTACMALPRVVALSPYAVNGQARLPLFGPPSAPCGPNQLGPGSPARSVVGQDGMYVHMYVPR